MKHSLLFHSILLAALSAAGGHLSFAQFGWLWQNPLPQGNNLRGVSFTDANTGTAVGEAGTILRTTNGGASWTSQPSGTTTWLCGISFTNADTGWVVGWNGTILRTSDGGASWTAQSSGTTHCLRSVSFTDASTGTAVGDSGTIFRTNSGGASWTSQSSGETKVLYSVSFTDAITGTAVGEAGTILRTTNGGASWTSQPSGTTSDLSSVSFTDANKGTAVGDYGTILRTTNGGVTAVEEDVSAAIPAGFCLKQNYPNPFNPSTTIGYQSTTQSHVTLKVFDMLGREVATLVNGLQQAGNRLVEFRAEHLPGGVYFYRLEGGGFVNVKKLILLK